jgi:hypothetical protein
MHHLLQGLASSDHTTLLLNCYAKLRDTAKLDRFLRAEGPDGKPALSFDVDTAIKARLFSGPLAVVSQMSSAMQASPALCGKSHARTRCLAFSVPSPGVPSGRLLHDGRCLARSMQYVV